MNIFKNQVLKSSLAITTHVGCRNQCSYCPQKSFIAAYGKRSNINVLSPVTFEKCISTVPGNICLSFSGFCEPWSNPHCTNMIILAHKKGHKIRVNTTLIGIKPEDITRLKEIPFIKFVIHLPDNKGFTKIKVDENYLNIAKLFLNSGIKNLTWKFHKTETEIEIHPQVKMLLNSAKTKIVTVDVNNRAGNVRANNSYQPVNKGKILCECQDFHHNILLPNGDVALCHMDWSLKHILGNLLTDKYNDLYSGDSFQKILLGLKVVDADILCRLCEKDIVKKNLFEITVNSLKKRIKGEKEIY